MIVAIWMWPRIAAVVAGWGPAPVLATAMLVILSVATESRVMSHLFPFLVVAAIEATADRWTPRRALAFAGLALVWSKLWWRIGYDQPHDAWSWPDQRFTMHQGPWASDATFLAHLGAAAVTAAILVLVLRAPTRRSLHPGRPTHQVAGSHSTQLEHQDSWRAPSIARFAAACGSARSLGLRMTGLARRRRRSLPQSVPAKTGTSRRGTR